MIFLFKILWEHTTLAEKTKSQLTIDYSVDIFIHSWETR